MEVHATYRLQLRADFTFGAASRIAPYLAELGISHCYASPYLKARPGSAHGYDITDHGQLNPELGGDTEYAVWMEALQNHGLGQILDIVPNHMSIVSNENRWWNEVLEIGPASAYAEYFDIDWSPSTRPDLAGRVLVPILGEPYGKALEAQLLRLSYEAGEFAIYYFEHRFPVKPQSFALILSHHIDELEKALGLESPAFVEYQSILTAIKNLPPRGTATPERRLELQREKEVIKRRLAALSGENPQVAEFIERIVARFNGQPGDPASFDLLDQLLDEQAYRLAYWRVAADEINYRRFFDINELAALSMERPEVFAATHERVLRLLREGKIDGLRVDHPDGLFDPRQYMQRLQGEAGRRLYLVAEKILTGDEKLPEDWPIAGTTGYEFLNTVSGLFIEPSAAAAFTRLYHTLTGDDTPFAEVAYQKKILILQIALSSELQMLTHQLDRLAQRNRWSRDFTWLSLRRALREVIACFPVYRSYVAQGELHESDRRYINRAIRVATTRNPALSSAILRFIHDTLLLEPFRGGPIDEAYRAEQQLFVGRFQQVTAPVMAKGIEDTAFYVYNRFISLNEVGGNPDRFGVAPEALHRFFDERQRSWPRALSASSTHDTKRSEDVRARLNALSELPEEWAERVERWRELNRVHRIELEDGQAPDANEEYLLYQTLLGAWPIPPYTQQECAAFIERMQNYMTKALHEAKVHTSWINPNVEYDKAIREFVRRILSPDVARMFLDDFLPFQKRISDLGMFNSLAQTLLKLTAPGVPDIYQGTELWDFSLVDPDNRRPVDFAHRSRLLHELRERTRACGADLRPLAADLVKRKEDGRIKLYVIWRTLNAWRRQVFRNDRTLSAEVGMAGTPASTPPTVKAEEEYQPLEITGTLREHVFAFIRRINGHAALVAVPRLAWRAGLVDEFGQWKRHAWADTEIRLPNGCAGFRWLNIFTSEIVTCADQDQPSLPVDTLLGTFPVCLLREQT